MTKVNVSGAPHALFQIGDNDALAALATVDVAFPRLSEAQRRTIKIALVACAVPHWCDESFLAALLGTARKGGSVLVKRLRTLNVVEDFPARGPSAFNVHSAARLAIRRYLRENSPSEWLLFAKRAYSYLSDRTDQIAKIESLYHQFSFLSEEAVRNCRALDREFTSAGLTDARFLLSTYLTELVEGGEVAGSARAEATIVGLSFAGYRLSNKDKQAALEWVLDESKRIEYVHGIERSWLLLGDYRREHGRSAEALVAYKQSFETSHQQFLTGEDTLYWGHRLGVACSRVAQIQSAVGNSDDAIAWANRYLDIARLGLADYPNAPDRMRRLALAHIQVGGAFEAKGKDQNARYHFQEALSICLRLTETVTQHVDLLRDLSVVHSRLGDLEELTGNLDLASAHFSEDLRIVRELVASDSENLRWKHDLTLSLARVGQLRESSGELTTAVEAQEERLSILRELIEHDPANLSWRRSMASALRSLSSVYERQERYEKSYAAGTQAKEEFRYLVDLDPANSVWKRELAVSHRRLSDLHTRLGRIADSAEELGAALAIYEALASTPLAPGEWIRGLSLTHSALSRALLDAGKALEAREHGLLAIKAMERAVACAPDRVGWVSELAELRELHA